jgi:hypothetical protein
MNHGPHFYLAILFLAAFVTYSIHSTGSLLLKRRMEWVEELAQFGRQQFAKLDMDHDKVVTRADLRAYIAQKELEYGHKLFAEALLGNLKRFGKVIKRVPYHLPLMGEFTGSHMPRRRVFGLVWSDLAEAESRNRNRLKRWHGES